MGSAGRIGALACGLHLDGSREQNARQNHRRHECGGRAAGHGYLKSRRENTSDAIASSMAMYSAA